jgi:hypothetical protein
MFCVVANAMLTKTPPPFRFPLRRGSERYARPARGSQASAVAQELLRLARDLIRPGPGALDEEVLGALDRHPTSTSQLAKILRRRKTNVCAAVHRLVQSKQIERCGQQWRRVKEER